MHKAEISLLLNTSNKFWVSIRGQYQKNISNKRNYLMKRIFNRRKTGMGEYSACVHAYQIFPEGKIQHLFIFPGGKLDYTRFSWG